LVSIIKFPFYRCIKTIEGCLVYSTDFTQCVTCDPATPNYVKINESPNFKCGSVVIAGCDVYNRAITTCVTCLSATSNLVITDTLPNLVCITNPIENC
jgi:hypothetical protein